MKTWPPTTAIAGRESQRVGKALASPWSPKAVQALWILFTKEIRFSIHRFNCEFVFCVVLFFFRLVRGMNLCWKDELLSI